VQYQDIRTASISFENVKKYMIALRGMSGRDEEDVTRGWKKMHKEELHDFHVSPHIIRMIKSGRKRWPINVTRQGEELLGVDLEGNTLFGGPTSRWDNNKIYHKETG
jgi:hypothetical protein